MATAKIQAPDGKIITLEVPDGATEQQIMDFVNANYKAQAAPQPPAQEANQETAVQQLAGEQGIGESIAISAGRGMENLGRGFGKMAQSGALGLPTKYLSNLFPKVEERDPDSAEEQAYKALQEKRPYSTMAGEIIGETVPALPFGLAAAGAKAAGARISGTALAGAAETGLSASGRDESADQVASSAGIGGVVAGASEAFIPLFGKLIGKAVARVTGREATDVLDESGNVIPEIKNLLKASGVNVDEIKSQAVKLTYESPKNADEAARLARFKEQGVPFTPGDITGEFKQRSKEARLSEIQEEFADPLRQVKITQSNRIDEIRTDLAEGLGKFSDEETGQFTKEGLELAEKLAKSDVKTKYKQLADASGFSGGMPLPIDPIHEVFSQPSVSGMIKRLTPDEKNKIQSALVEFGIEQDEELVSSFMGSGSTGLMGKEAAITPLTTENSEKFVQALNSVIDMNSSNELRGLVGNIKGAVESSYDLIDDQVGGELVSLAKEARKANVAYKQDFSPKALAGKLIKVQNDRITPLVESSKIYSTLFKSSTPIEQRRKTLELLRRSDKGANAIKSLQSNMIMDIFDAGFIPSSRMNNQQMFSGNAAQRYADKIGQDSIDELFKDNPKLYKDVMDLLQTGIDITPSNKEVVKGSGSVVLNLANQMADLTMASKLPAIGSLLTSLNRLARGNKDQRAIKEIMERSPLLKKQIEFINDSLPNFGAAIGLTSGAALAKSEKENDKSN